MEQFRTNTAREARRFVSGVREEWEQAKAQVTDAHWSEWLAACTVSLCVLGAMASADEGTFAVTMFIGIATLFFAQAWCDRIRAGLEGQTWSQAINDFFARLSQRQVALIYAGIFLLMCLLTAAWHVGLHPVGDGSLPFNAIFF